MSTWHDKNNPPLCLVCNEPVYNEKRCKDGSYPKYAIHSKCNSKEINVCGGHISPPGLEEIEKQQHHYEPKRKIPVPIKDP